MRSRPASNILVGLVTSLAVAAHPAAAQAAHAHDGHDGTEPGDVGRVHFPTSCRPPAARAVEEGVALLHSFWYERAKERFDAAAAADSGCAMAYWGAATSYLHPLWQPPTEDDVRQGRALAERARHAGRLAASPRERGYVEAIAAYYDGAAGRTHAERMTGYRAALEALHAGHPQDDEATMFLALALIASASPTDTTYALQRRAGALLEGLVRRYPNHPGLAHYLIHAYDSPRLADRALAAARSYTQIAPAVPHARHMPSHIFVRAGLWRDVVASNESAVDAGLAFERDRHLAAPWDQRLHSEDYLVYGWLQLGRADSARRVRDELAGVAATTPGGTLAADYALAAIPARYALERDAWAEARTLPVRRSTNWPATEAITYFARAVGAGRTGDLPTARTALDSLQAIEGRLTSAPAMRDGVRAQRLAASAWVALATGDTAGALRSASAAAALEDATEKHPVTPGAVLPARELEGDLLTALGRPADALRSYETVLRFAPGRRRSLAGAAGAAEASGDPASARRLRALLRAQGG
jgi:hypothetical protein